MDTRVKTGVGFAVVLLAVGGLLVLLAPTFGPSNSDNYCFIDKGILTSSQPKGAQFTLSGRESGCTEIHIYEFSAQEGQVVHFRLEPSTKNNFGLCVGIRREPISCLAETDGGENGEVSELETSFPSGGMYILSVSARGRLGEYQIDMESLSE
jgi:hypothetical protein